MIGFPGGVHDSAGKIGETMKKLLILGILTIILGCGEVSWQRKYVVPITIYEGATAIVNIELPIDMKKQPDTKPNIPIDVSIPLIPKGLSTDNGFVIPQNTGTLLVIWKIKNNENKLSDSKN